MRTQYNISEPAKLAIDIYHGTPRKYSLDEANDKLYKALIAANGGKDYLTYKSIRDGQSRGLFTILEEILSVTIPEGLQGDEYFNNLVDFRNLSLVDHNKFLVEDSILYQVSDVASGTQGLRRQRLGGTTEYTIPTRLKGVEIYEEGDRILSGRIDMNEFIRTVGDSMRQKLLGDIYGVWANATADDFGGSVYFPAAGAYDEETLLTMIDHVVAVSGGRTPMVLCTRKMARKMAPSVQGSDSEADIYNRGYYTNFYGTPVIVTPQRHKVGTTDFIFDDNTIHVISGDSKPIKCVYEGTSTIVAGNINSHADFTQHYMYTEKYGIGIVLAGVNSGIGRYITT